MNASSYDKTNALAYKYQESVCDRIIDICKPLTQYFGIKLFGYYKIFLDGRYFFTSTDLNLSGFILDMVAQKNCAFWDGTVFLNQSAASDTIVPLIFSSPQCPIDVGIY